MAKIGSNGKIANFVSLSFAGCGLCQSQNVSSHITMRNTPSIFSGEIPVDLMERKIKSLPFLTAIHSPDHSILIHGMGGQSRRFYKNLRHNKSVELLWTGWSSNIWWTYLLSFIPGQAGLTRVLDRTQLDRLYLDIGEQNMCGLYFIPRHKTISVLDSILKDRTSDIKGIFKNESDYFLLTVDFDFHGGSRDGEFYYRELVFGEELDESIQATLTRAE